jgi:hypothetical protein
VAKKHEGLQLVTVWFPGDWLPLIEKARGKVELSEFIRRAVAEKIGRKMPPGPKRGRPRVKPDG